MDQENNRKNDRDQCSVPVDGKKGSVFENMKTLDISQDGIGFVSDREISVDEQIAIEMEMKRDGYSILKKGYVKWVEQIPDSDCYRFGMHLKEDL